MEKNKFRKEEVISYVEDLIKCGAANDEQEELYLTYKWTSKLDKSLLKATLKEMRKAWNEKF